MQSTSFKPSMRENIAFLLTAILILGVGVLKPGYNWDIVGYVAAAHHYDGLAGAELSKRTYAVVHAEVGDDHFARLTQGDYVGAVYQDPEALTQQLPFYTPRLIYIELMRALNVIGINYAASTYLISAVFAFGAILLVGQFCKRLEVSLYWVPVMAFFGGFAALPRLSTPDAMACFFSLLALYLLAVRSRWVYLCIALLPLVRTDYIICSGLLTLYLVFRGHRWLAIGSGLVALGFYFGLNKVMGNYGYLTIFNFTLMGSDPYPASMAIASELSAYIKPYLSAAVVLLKHPQSFLYVLALYLVWLRKGYRVLGEPVHAGLWVSILFIVAHMALFPSYQERFLAFANTMILLATFACLSRATQQDLDAADPG